MRPTLFERFWSKVDRSEPGCWEWQAGRFTTGYGAFRLAGRQQQAHRIAYRLAKGPIPDGMHVLHRCDNKPCVRPDHLFLGTLSDNARDMVAKGRSGPQNGKSPRGEQHGSAKLAAVDIPRIRALLELGVPRSVIARTWGVSNAAIWLIEHGRTWREVA